MVRTAVLDGWKMLVATRGTRTVEQVFDLRSDPGETTTLPPTAAPDAAALRRLLAESERVERDSRAALRTDISDESHRALAGLGYLGKDSCYGK